MAKLPQLPKMTEERTSEILEEFGLGQFQYQFWLELGKMNRIMPGKPSEETSTYDSGTYIFMKIPLFVNNEKTGEFQFAMDDKRNVRSVSYFGKHPLANAANPEIGCILYGDSLLRYDAWEKIKFPGRMADIFEHYTATQKASRTPSALQESL
jgi:hypothetical protein